MTTTIFKSIEPRPAPVKTEGLVPWIRKNLFGNHWIGPCAPKGNAPQHYVFTLIATSLEANTLAPGLDKAAVLDALRGGKALGAASLVLRFNH